MRTRTKYTETPVANKDVLFEYTGLTGLSVTGNITGARYRFPYAGHRQLVDYRDAPAMRGISVLRELAEGS